VINQNGTCHASGWCSGPGYGGPTRTAVVLIDGSIVAKGEANFPRKIAGPHGFIIDFDCKELSSGNHEVVIACNCTAPGYACPKVLELTLRHNEEHF
jgi:hypothetical protein